MSCKHSSWLKFLQSNGEVLVEVSDRPRRLLKQYEEYSQKRGGFVLLVGNERKAEALAQLNVSMEPSNESRCRLSVDLSFRPPMNKQEAPIIVAGSSVAPYKQLRDVQSSLAPCHESATHSLTRPQNYTIQESIDHFYHRTIFPFLDTVCIFVNDLGGMRAAARVVCRWAANGRVAVKTLPPRLLLVLDEGDTLAAVKNFEKQCMTEGNINIALSYHRIQAINLTLSRRVKSRQRRHWDRFRREVVDGVNSMHYEKHLQHRLYSFKHLVAYMKVATDTIESSDKPFDFLSVSRIHFPISQEAEACFSDFINRVESIEQIHQFAVPLIASCILFDHYRRQMHYFLPQDVFNTFYKDICRKASPRTFQGVDNTQWLMMPSAFVNLVRKELSLQYERLDRSKSTMAFHKNTLSMFEHQLLPFMSQNTCFSCLMRRPKIRLTCGHWICQSCFEAFGHPQKGRLRQCLLCGQDVIDIKQRLKPPTATVRIMCIDGGGARGGIPLKFIQDLQERVGLPCPVQNHFDILFGTSSGAISACALGIKGWDIQDCLAVCRIIAQKTFEPRLSVISQIKRLPCVRMWLQNALSLILDSRYSSKNLEEVLQEIFGLTTTMADWSYANENGIHVGFPITSIDDAATILINNYNSIGARDVADEYETLQSDDVLIWQALRATTAAPFFFKPQTIGENDYQDGGVVRYNNPVGLAVEEAARLFPETPRPSIVVSFGTGSPRRRVSRPSQARSHRVNKSRAKKARSARFASRLFQAFLKQGDSTVAWKQLLSHTKSHDYGEFFRFDVEFDGKGPSLDDVTDLEGLEELAQASLVSSSAMERLARCIRAENFYFELERDPIYTNGVYECSGRIFCRLEPGSEELEALLTQLDHNNSFLTASGRKLTGKFQNSLTPSGIFSKRCKFYLRDKAAPFSIVLTEGVAASCNINGSPFTLEWLREVQQIDAPFGRRDYL